MLCQVASSCHPQLGCQPLQDKALQKRLLLAVMSFYSGRLEYASAA